VRGREPIVLRARLAPLTDPIERRGELEPRVVLVDVAGERGLEVTDRLVELGLCVGDAEVLAAIAAAVAVILNDENGHIDLPTPPEPVSP